MWDHSMNVARVAIGALNGAWSDHGQAGDTGTVRGPAGQVI
jgi:hypothetical protein